MIGMRGVVLLFGAGWLMLVALAGLLMFLPVSADGPSDDRAAAIERMMEEEVNKSGSAEKGLVKWTDPADGNDSGEKSGASFAEPQMLVNPYGCKGKTNDPHKSVTNPQNANVHAQTTCPPPPCDASALCFNPAIQAELQFYL